MFTACKDYLEVEPLTKIPAKVFLTDESGIKSLLANLYIRMPIECFTFNPGSSFNYHQSDRSDFGFSTSFFTDESVYSAGRWGSVASDGYWPYASIRQTNEFIENLLIVDLTDDVRNRLISEAHFIRAYLYFGLARRYGGVPIIKAVQLPTDDLFVPRSTEKETWDFVLEECDLAIQNLPLTVGSNDGIYRATKWAAYALKSRAALHAASIAKYWNNAPLVGEAVDEKLVGGMTNADANNYYTQCLAASSAIIDNSGKTLYKPTPATSTEAAKNIQDLFGNPSGAMEEVIFLKAYIDGTATSSQGHSYDCIFNPSQTQMYNYHGRFNPALDLVDLFEDYTDDGTGKSKLLVTRTDNIEDVYLATPVDLDLSIPYVKYDNVTDIFTGKDARLFGSIITPGSIWKNITMVFQGGLIKPDGTKLLYQNNNAVGLDGNTYYTYGGATKPEYSGFAELGSNEAGNFSTTGFSIKKFLDESLLVGLQFSSTTPYIDFRLAEIYLNYAEAAIESGSGDAAKAAEYLNAIRKRAAHTDNIPATLENILKERRVELAFEGHRYWDLVRRRDYHTLFANTSRKALVPILDLRENPPKYIFVRANNYADNNAGGRRFEPRTYYKSIPGVSTNQLIQNPEY